MHTMDICIDSNDMSSIYWRHVELFRFIKSHWSAQCMFYDGIFFFAPYFINAEMFEDVLHVKKYAFRFKIEDPFLYILWVNPDIFKDEKRPVLKMVSLEPS